MRPLTIADAIEMTQNGDRRQVEDYFARGNVGLFSPDRSRFAFVTEKANLKDDPKSAIDFFKSTKGVAGASGKWQEGLASDGWFAVYIISSSGRDFSWQLGEKWRQLR